MERESSENNARYDFFIAHSHKDKKVARELYDSILKNNFTAFLDQTGIEPGTFWDQEIPKAHKQSLITLALISGNIREAHYARDEIHTAINLARTNPESHRVIPVYLDNSLEDSPDIVYGLRLIQGIKLSSSGGIENLVISICKYAKDFKLKASPTGDTEGLHILHSYPTGPFVKPHDIPRSLIEMYASFINESEARLVVSETNAFRQEANHGTPFIIPLHKVPSPDRIPSFEFWMHVFNYASLQGPRMLAALILTVPDDMFEMKAKYARAQLLEKLKNYS